MENQNNNELSIYKFPSDLSLIYDSENIDIEKARYENLLSNFFTIYSSKASHVIRAPGRVNLIGEHIDYEGYSVLPMAIENDIIIAINSINSGKKTINISHLDATNFSSYQFENNSSPLNLQTPHDWVNYVIAGYNATLSIIKEHKLTNQGDSEWNLLFSGNVPPGSGLSSSSALTVASALAFVKFFQVEKSVTKKDLSNGTINYERSVGTACGGMDQTISIYAEKNQAKLIEFFPELKCHSVELPKDTTFIVANSLTKSTKIDTLAYRYNKRVVENKLALAILSKKLKLNKVYNTVISFQQALKLKFRELLKIINSHLKDGTYCLDEIKKELEGSPVYENSPDFSIDEVLSHIPHYSLVLKCNSSFILKERLLHVAEEAKRVLDFYQLCRNKEESKPEELGKLMSNSHLSCKQLYDCSSKELDDLVEYAMENKAEGARLTGAGWGGCCVILVKNENLNFLMQKLNLYYNDKFGDLIQSQKLNIKELFFKTKASQGAVILELF
jgi:N-acetylgalactosamine kinase